MQYVLGEAADEAARITGFVKRKRKLDGASFVQTTVFGWLGNGQASSSELNQAAAAVGVNISPQGLTKRFTAEAAACLRQVLETAVGQVVEAEPVALSLLERFNGVYLLDSSTVELPDSLATLWSGCGGSKGASSAVKVQVDLNYSNGALHRLWLQAGREHDQCRQAQAIELPGGALRIADLGYFKLDTLTAHSQRGVFWLSRLQAGTTVHDEAGQALDLGKWLNQQGSTLDCPIRLGSKHQLACRLLAVRVPTEVAAQRRRKLKRTAQKKGQTPSASRLALADWTLLITNAPIALLTLNDALALYRVRWQIELLFKFWKTGGGLDTSRSHNPWRILCEFYAKLIAMVVQHWLFLVSFWSYPNRSLTKAARTVQQHALHLAATCSKSWRCLAQAIDSIDRCLAAGCRINSRRAHPNTYQCLLAGSENA